MKRERQITGWSIAIGVTLVAAAALPLLFPHNGNGLTQWGQGFVSQRARLHGINPRMGEATELVAVPSRPGQPQPSPQPHVPHLPTIVRLAQGEATTDRAENGKHVEDAPSAERGKGDNTLLRTRMLIAVPWGNGAGQLGRNSTPDPVHDEFPADFCIGPDGMLWICDLVNDRVVAYRVTDNEARSGEPITQIKVKCPTHVAVNTEGVFVVDFPSRPRAGDPMRCRLYQVVDGRRRELAVLEDLGVGFLPGAVIPLSDDGTVLVLVGDRLHRITRDGQVHEVPGSAAGSSSVVDTTGIVYGVAEWARKQGVLKGKVRRRALESGKELEPIELAIPYDTGEEVDQQFLEAGFPHGQLVGADRDGRLYLTMYERLKSGRSRLTLAQFSPSGALLARDYFQPPGIDLQKAWRRCVMVFWRVTPDGRVLVSVPLDREYRILESSFVSNPRKGS